MDKKIIYIIVGVVAAGLLLMLGMNIRNSKANQEVTFPTPVPTMAATPTMTPVPTTGEQAATLSGTWSWTKTTMSDGKVTTPNDKDAFVMTLTNEGKISSTTDCNSLTGSYTLGADNSIKMSEFASTMMFCENSQADAYAKDLGQVSSYKVSGDELWLMLPYDSGTMVFTKQS